MNPLLLALALCGQVEPLSGYDRASRAVCRVNVGTSFGSGCAVDKDATKLYVLTNCHVASQGQTARVEFWRYGFKSVGIDAYCRWSKKGEWLDMSVLEVPLSSFDGWCPEVIPICEKSYEVKDRQTISSYGCPRGEWPKAWTGHIKSIEGRLMKFEPGSIGGQSGSAIFNSDFSKVIGLLAWNIDGEGGGMHARTLWAGLSGEVSSDKDPSIDEAFETCKVLKGLFQRRRGDCPDGNCPLPENPKPNRPNNPGGNKPAPIPGFGGGVTPIAPKPTDDYQKQIDEIKSALILISREKGPQGERGPAGADGKPGRDGKDGKDLSLELQRLTNELEIHKRQLELVSHAGTAFDSKVRDLLIDIQRKDGLLASMQKEVEQLRKESEQSSVKLRDALIQNQRQEITFQQLGTKVDSLEKKLSGQLRIKFKWDPKTGELAPVN